MPIPKHEMEPLTKSVRTGEAISLLIWIIEHCFIASTRHLLDLGIDFVT